MRRILVESARRRARVKPGGEVERVELPDFGLVGIHEAEELLALEEALTRSRLRLPHQTVLFRRPNVSAYPPTIEPLS